MKQRITPYLKSTTAISISECKKLSPFEKRMIKFLKNKSWLFALLPIINFIALGFSISQHTGWYYVLFLIIFFIVFLGFVEKYGKLSNTTYHCSCCNSELKYQGKDYYSDWYYCPKCKEDIEY